MSNKFAFAAAIAFILLAAAWFWQTQTLRSAPQVTFKSITGESIDMRSLAGQPALVTFWATDCPGCIEEIPHLIGLYQQYADQGLRIIAVAMPYDPPHHVKTMAESRQLPYTVALDPTGELTQAFGNVQLTPTTFLIDRQGYIVKQIVGTFDLTDMQNRLIKMLNGIAD